MNKRARKRKPKSTKIGKKSSIGLIREGGPEGTSSQGLAIGISGGARILDQVGPAAGPKVVW